MTTQEQIKEKRQEMKDLYASLENAKNIIESHGLLIKNCLFY
jgi:hypothetical protein